MRSRLQLISPSHGWHRPLKSDGCACRRLNSDPRSWNQTQISFSRKEVAKALDIYQMHIVIVQVRLERLAKPGTAESRAVISILVIGSNCSRCSRAFAVERLVQNGTVKCCHSHMDVEQMDMLGLSPRRDRRAAARGPQQPGAGVRGRRRGSRKHLRAAAAAELLPCHPQPAALNRRPTGCATNSLFNLSISTNVRIAIAASALTAELLFGVASCRVSVCCDWMSLCFLIRWRAVAGHWFHAASAHAAWLHS